MKAGGFKLASAANILAGRSDVLVEVRGWIARKHTVGGLVFVMVRDGSGYLQASAKKGVADDAYEVAKGVTIESAVVIRGEVRDDKRAPGGKEVSV